MSPLDLRDPLWSVLIGLAVCAVLSIAVSIQSQSHRIVPSSPLTFPVVLSVFVAILGIGGVIGLLISPRSSTKTNLAAGFGGAIVLNVILAVVLLARRYRS